MVIIRRMEKLTDRQEALSGRTENFESMNHKVVRKSTLFENTSRERRQTRYVASHESRYVARNCLCIRIIHS